MIIRVDPVLKFLKDRTFHCPHLNNARITPEQCVGRQLREIETKFFGRKLIVNNTIFDAYCRSGCCQTGLVHLKRREPEAYALRMRERKAKDRKKVPCIHLGAVTT